MLNLGEINVLTALRQTDNGIYLVDEESNEVLLPNKYIPEGMQLGESIEVFLYKDSEDRPIATNLTPKIMVNGYAFLEAKVVSSVGAFFDWGLEKDLLVPFSEQTKPIEEGKRYVIHLFLDKITFRLAGTTKISKSFRKIPVDLNIGDKVNLLVYEATDIGYHAVVNNCYQGMLFKNEVFEAIHPGQELTGYVKKIREDHKIDLSLNRFGYRGVDVNVEKLLKALDENRGHLGLHDHSAPEEIYKQLGMSKKVFKKAVGALYKQKRLELTKTGIRLIA